jgi:GTP:adenosylcobinamide-phosphate guanylyltransferase
MEAVGINTPEDLRRVEKYLHDGDAGGRRPGPR